MGDYLAAKRRLFESLDAESVAVINRHDKCSDEMADAARRTGAAVVVYGLDDPVACTGRIVSLEDSGTSFAIRIGDAEAEVHSPLIGRHNVLNSLAAAGAADALGVDLATIAAALESSPPVPGRLEPVAGSCDYRVFVDYAHTDDALANVLKALDKLKRGRLIVMFGCGGDRDRKKRPRMAAVAARLADHVIVTSDNPRTEEPRAIVDEILTGLSADDLGRCDVRLDRREAIALAIDMARGDDIVLLAGKGHETYQEIGKKRIDFSDVEVAGEMIRRREDRR